MSANGKALAFVECRLDALLSLSQECQSNERNSCSGGLVSDKVSYMVSDVVGGGLVSDVIAMVVCSVIWSVVVWSVIWSVMWSVVVWSVMW